MMILKRKALTYLKDWKNKTNKKPILIRGARQVGKSTLVREFSAEYPHFITLNLERYADAQFFKSEDSVEEILEILFLEYKINAPLSEVLLFIDEIQEVPRAIKLLRYFYEDLPELSVIAAGSLLDFALADVGSFPVGRVVQYVLHPLDFEEFLMASGEEMALQYLQTIPLKKVAYQKLLHLFHRYIIIGGMPEVVKTYLSNDNSLIALAEIYASIWNNYQADVVKYGKSTSNIEVIKHIMNTIAGERDRISYAGFGHSDYKSRQVKEAFRALDQARVLQIVYPTASVALPIEKIYNRKPKIQFLDTGLLNFANGIQAEMLKVTDFSSIYKGYFVNHIVHQELIAQHYLPNYTPSFWIRENPKANAEVDIVVQHGKYIIPVEVKSGGKGRLRSLHEFMDRTNHSYAVRLLANKVSVETVTSSKGKEYQLLNLPYFLASQLDKYLDWFIKEA